MPVIDLQRQLSEIGRIRMGRKVPTGRKNQRTGEIIMRPDKIDQFRLTSRDKDALEKAAVLYGGTVTDWEGHPGEYELFTTSKKLPIFLSPADVSQWYEHWSGGGCQRRCDGRTCTLYQLSKGTGPNGSDEENRMEKGCQCSQDPKKRECKLTTRATFMLRELPNIGGWRLESHGFFAAIEIPTSMEILRQAGGMLRASLELVPRFVVSFGKRKDFFVPVIKLEAQVALQDALEGNAGTRALGGNRAPALPMTVGGGVIHDALEAEFVEGGESTPEYGLAEETRQALASEYTIEGKSLALWISMRAVPNEVTVREVFERVKATKSLAAVLLGRKPVTWGEFLEASGGSSQGTLV